MKEKVENYFLIKVNFIIPLILLLLFSLWLISFLGTEVFLETLSKIIYWISAWKGWFIISPVALLITAIFIYEQASATKEMVKFQWVPRVAVGMVSAKPQCPYNRQDEEQMGTRFVFHNYTEAVVWVWRKLEVKIDGKKIDKSLAKRVLGDDLLGKNPLPVRGTSKESGTGFLMTAPYGFLLNIIREKNIENVRNKKITAELKYWSAYNNKKQKDPLIFGPVPYYFNIKRGGWIVGGGLGIRFNISP